MLNPKIIYPIHEGAEYKLPTYIVSDEGIIDGEGIILKFCKGNKDDSSIFRQEGLFTESLIQLAKQHLEFVNVGNLSSRETYIAITKLEEAMMWLNKRAEDRELREVQGTYNK